MGTLSALCRGAKVTFQPLALLCPGVAIRHLVVLLTTNQFQSQWYVIEVSVIAAPHSEVPIFKLITFSGKISKHKISITYKNKHVFLTSRNKLLKSIGAVLFQAVDQVDIFPMCFYLGLYSSQQMPGTCFIMQRLATPRVASGNI